MTDVLDASGIDIKVFDLPLEALLAIADVCVISAQECFIGNLAIKAQLSDCALFVLSEEDEGCGHVGAVALPAECRTWGGCKILDSSEDQTKFSLFTQHRTTLLTEVRRDWFVSGFIELLYTLHEKRVLALPASEHDAFSQIKYALKSARLRSLLFSGFSHLAKDGLHLMVEEPAEARYERMSACWHLIMWYHIEEDYDKAYALIERCKQFSLYSPDLLLQAEAFCLLLSNKYELAAEVLEKCFAERNVGADFLVLHATAARQKFLREGMDEAQADKEFLCLLDRAFRFMGLAPLEVRDVGQPLSLANIHAPKAPAESDCPELVSVIFPVHNMDESIAYAVRSMQEQTWKNIEIIVVDDASTDGSALTVEAMAKGDDRIKLIRLPQNQGTFAAVNIGMKAARGSFISIHGGDDWSHPQKVAKQLQYLSQNPDAVALESRMYRVDMNIDVCNPWRLMPYITPDPSLLFTRDALLGLGGWDDARFSADTELTRRTRAKFGDAAVVAMPENAVFLLALRGRLTTTKKTGSRSWQTVIGARRMYANAYAVWHREAKKNNHSLHIADKAFDAPLANRREREDIVKFDVVVLDDFASDEAYAGAGFILATKMRAKGLTVALLHWRSPFVDPVRTISQGVYEQSYSQGICILNSADTIEADSFLIADHGLMVAMPEDLPVINVVCTSFLTE
ncbi:glycosyltransferase [Desulfovibrio sp. OttesenSCG-928-G15]|nr:glycosyltransferase [Desulfovibrio sp. OttesenSCG-928-G15]